MERAHIHIHTGGSFVYDLTKEFAWFESPPGRESLLKADDPLAPEQVHVQRLQIIDGKQKLDQLTCDRLDLQFRRKTPGDRANSSDKEIETAKAIKRGKNDVAIAFETGDMAAYGTELFYRAGDLVNGPITILKGEPLRAMKDGHKLVCKELHLFAANRAGEGQKAWARGPGQIDLLDAKQPLKQSFPTHLLWRDTLSVTKEKEGNLAYDLMTVVGEASFIDDLQKQELHGEKIMVWLRQTQDIANEAHASGGSSRQELHKVYAQDRVRALSPEFIIRQSNRLTMSFFPVVARNDRLPDVTPKTETKKGPAGNPGISLVTPTPLVEEKVMPKPAATVAEKKPAPPIELQANDITVAISTMGTKHQLQDMVAKGAVIVYQAGDKPGEKRIDVTGELLTVKKVGEQGDILTVHGDGKRLARLEIGELLLKGPIITINQALNRADVDGLGVMEMPSNKNLDGSENKKKAGRLSIEFNKSMTFDGRNAHFSGGVQAREIGARSGLLCQELVATLDRMVSFKDGEKEGQNAKIDRIVCDKNVYADDCKVDDKGQFVQRTILQGVAVSIHNEAGPSSTDIRGPGLLKLLAKGSADQGLVAAPNANAPKGTAKSEWKLTHIVFRDRMSAHTEGDAKIAQFYGDYAGVEVFHFPTTIIEQKMDPNHPPKDGLYLRCEMLQVKAETIGERTIHTMIARRNVEFRTEQYLGYADVVKYDETNDRVIFEGLNGNLVRLYQPSNNGERVPAFTGTKVLYNRKTGKLTTDGVQSISN